MANDDAWNAGWKKGTDAANKGKKNKTDEKGGQDAWSVGWKLGGAAKPSFYAKGGKVRKTGIAKVHKGELVLTAAQARQCAAKKGKSKSGARKRVTAKG